MKSKMVLFLVLSLVLLLISPACSADFDTNRLTGSFYPAAAERICSGTSDPYGFWTQDSSYKSFLAIALEKDFCREEPLGYNYCFPINSLACVLSYSGARKDNTIRVMYVCFVSFISARMVFPSSTETLTVTSGHTSGVAMAVRRHCFIAE